MKFPPWHQRPDDFDPAQHREGVLDSQSFLRVADQFISLANQRNKKIDSTELQMVMLYAAARYAAHVGKNVIEITDQPHQGCAKFTQRFGLDAHRFVNSEVGTELHLRGVNARVVTPGTIRRGGTPTAARKGSADKVI